jgi:hypothetical protein
MLTRYDGSHPSIMEQWLDTEAQQDFAIDPNYRLTTRDKRLRLKQAIERLTGLDLSRKHFRLVA